MSHLSSEELGSSDDYDTIGRTKELCDLFTSTVSSLAVDAATLKQLTSLRLVVGSIDENRNPNDDDKNKTTDATDMMEQLYQIDSSVTELENKMGVLREIVSEENRSLQELEAVKHAAEAQKQVLEHMLETSKDLRLPGDSDAPRSNDKGQGANAALDTRRPSNMTTSSRSKSDSSNHRSKKEQKREQQQQEDRSSISIPLVTESEWNSVSRNIRGRITLAVLNDAVVDIENACRHKYAVLHRNKQPASSKRITGPRALQMEKQYQKQLNTHRDLQVEEHGDGPWVSEQDLRQVCAFFRSGESTARAILIILRTLKRLKQVPGKNSQVTYVILPKTK